MTLDFLSPLHPRHFGVPVALWEVAQNYAEAYTAEQVAAEQEACVAECKDGRYWFEIAKAIRAKAQEATGKESLPVDLDRCPSCGGPADNGNDRLIPPNPYPCSKCEDISPGS